MILINFLCWVGGLNMCFFPSLFWGCADEMRNASSACLLARSVDSFRSEVVWGWAKVWMWLWCNKSTVKGCKACELRVGADKYLARKLIFLFHLQWWRLFCRWRARFTWLKWRIDFFSSLFLKSWSHRSFTHTRDYCIPHSRFFIAPLTTWHTRTMAIENKCVTPNKSPLPLGLTVKIRGRVIWISHAGSN